jgi:hypothetical protein
MCASICARVSGPTGLSAGTGDGADAGSRRQHRLVAHRREAELLPGHHAPVHHRDEVMPAHSSVRAASAARGPPLREINTTGVPSG